MPIPQGAVQRLQQEKPQTYEALARFITTLASAPQDDAALSTMVGAISDQLAMPTQPTATRTMPEAQNNMTGQPYDRAAVEAQMQPVQ